MTEVETEEQRFLASTRRALSPTAADAERVLAAVGRAIALPAPGSEGAAPHAGEPSAALSVRLPSALPRWLLTAALAGGVGALGYGLGFRAGTRSAADNRATSQQSSSPDAVMREAPQEVRAPDVLAAPSAAASFEPRRAPSTSSSRPEIPVPAHSTAASLRPNASSLAEEVRTLKRVERALRDRNPRLALALLADLDRSVPSGQLGEQRRAATIQARCSLGYGSPSALLREFTEAYPTSAYVTRIRQACDSGAPGDASTKE